MVHILQSCGHSYFSGLLSENSLVIDLGAHKAEFTRSVIDTFSCRVYAVEAVPELFARIEENQKVRKFNYCIAGIKGKIQLNIPPDRCATIYSVHESNTHSIYVEGIGINEFLKMHNITSVDLLKVDIEGAELDLFESITLENLNKIKQITVEFHDFLYPEMRNRVEKVKKDMVALGFYCIPFSFTTNGDVLFVRRGAISLPYYLYAKYFLRYVMGIKRLARRIVKKPR